MMFKKINVRTDPGYYFRERGDFPFPEIFEVVKVWEILQKKDEVLKAITGREISVQVPANCVIEGPVFIGEGTEIMPFTCIITTKEKPVYIGKNCRVGPHAFIRPGVILGNNVEIGRTEVKDSVILNGTKSMHHGYIGDSVIGREVNVATSLDTGNLKHTGSKVRAGGMETGRAKFGAVIGDFCKTGCKTTLYPGTMLGPNVWTDEGCVIGGFVPEKTFVRAELKIRMEKLKDKYSR